MALVYSKQFLSGSTSGLPIEVNGTSSPGTTIHTGPSATVAREEVYLYLTNAATLDTEVTIEWGGTATAEAFHFTVPSRDGPYQVSPGFPLTATTSIVRAYATATGRIHAMGWVNRAT